RRPRRYRLPGNSRSSGRSVCSRNDPERSLPRPDLSMGSGVSWHMRCSPLPETEAFARDANTGRTKTMWTTLVTIALMAAACTISTTQTASRPSSPPAAPRTTQTVDAAQAEKLKRVMVPLLRAMDHPRSSAQVKVGVVDDPHINAASAGSGEFYVTTGLLQK